LFERKSACLLAPQSSPISQQTVVQVEPQLNPTTEATLVNHSNEPLQSQTEVEKLEIVEAVAEQVLQVASHKMYLYQHIKSLYQEDYTQRQIARELRVSRHTVKKYLLAERVPRYTPLATSHKATFTPLIARVLPSGLNTT